LNVANSKRKLILDYIKATTLPLITTGGGYNSTIALVKRGVTSLDSVADSELPALFLGKTIEKRENITRNQFKSTITLFVVGFANSADGFSDAQGPLDNLIEDTTHALETDRTLGGNAKWLEIKNVVTDDGNLDPRAGFVMEVEIAYVTEGTMP
jgi:hypothetical protein